MTVSEWKKKYDLENPNAKLRIISAAELVSLERDEESSSINQE